jgi:Tfp pilus assembly protein PilF
LAGSFIALRKSGAFFRRFLLRRPLFESVPTKTLYDLLGIRPDADGESLKKAFRKAAKAHHPDLHAGDPDAPLRFRQIAAAHAILRDAKQRTAYDRLVELERQRFRSQWRRIIISDTIAVAAFSVALLGGDALFAPIPTTAIVAVKVDKDTARGPAEVAAVQPAAQTDTTGRDGPHDKHEGVAVPNRVIAPSAEPVTNSGDTQVIADHKLALGLLSNDAKFHRERGIASYRNGDFHRAIADLDQAIRLDPNDAQAYNIRGNAWDYVGASDRALADYDEAIRIDPNNAAVFHDRGIMWRRKGELDRALVDLDRAIRFSFSDASIYSDRGLIWYEKGRYDRATADFNQAVKIDPNFARAYINGGITLHRKSDFDRAFADVDQAIRTNPNIFDVIRREYLPAAVMPARIPAYARIHREN